MNQKKKTSVGLPIMRLGTAPEAVADVYIVYEMLVLYLQHVLGVDYARYLHCHPALSCNRPKRIRI